MGDRLEQLEQIDPQLLGWAAGALVLFALLVWGYRIHRRRLAARRELLHALKSVAYDALRNVLVPDGMEGHLHVDFLLLTQRGILVLDLREIPGLVFGGDQMDQWTAMTRSSRYTFANPLGALLDRVAAVKQIASDVPVEGRVLFTRRARFPKGRPKSVLLLDSIKPEYAPVDKRTMEDVVSKFRPSWERLKASTRRSDLARMRYWASTPPSGFSPSMTRTLVLIAALAVLGALGVMIPRAVTDGTERFAGAARTAAEQALMRAQVGCLDPPITRLIARKLKVVALQLDPGFSSGQHAYEARVRAYTLFAIPIGTISVNPGGGIDCRDLVWLWTS